MNYLADLRLLSLALLLISACQNGTERISHSLSERIARLETAQTPYDTARFTDIPPLAAFDFAVGASRRDSDEAIRYILSHPDKFDSLLTTVARDSTCDHRLLALLLLGRQPFLPHSISPLFKIFDDPVPEIWQTAVDRLIEIAPQFRQETKALGYFWRGRGTEKWIYLIAHTGHLVERRIIDGYNISIGFEDNDSKIREAAFEAIAAMNSYNESIASSLIRHLLMDSTDLRQRTLNLVAERPILVLPTLFIYRSDHPSQQWRSTYDQILDAMSLDKVEMVGILEMTLSECQTPQDSINILRALGTIGAHARAYEDVVVQYIGHDNEYYKAYMVLALSRINPDYPGLVEMIKNGLIGAEAEHKHNEQIRRAAEEYYRDSEEDDGGEFCPEPFWASYLAARQAYLTAADVLGQRAVSLVPEIVPMFNLGLPAETASALRAMGDAASSALPIILNQNTGLMRVKEAAELVRYLEPDERRLIRYLLDGIESENPDERTNAFWSLAKLGIRDSLCIVAAGNVLIATDLQPRNPGLDAESSSAIEYLNTVGQEARYAAAGLGRVVFTAYWNQMPFVPADILVRLGPDAEPALKEIVERLLAGEKPLNSQFFQDILVRISKAIGEPALPHLLKLLGNEMPWVEEIGWNGIRSLRSKTVGVAPQMLNALENRYNGLALQHLLKLGDDVWEVHRRMLTNQDLNIRRGAVVLSYQIYLTQDSCRDSTLLLLKTFAADERDPLRQDAQKALEQLKSNSSDAKTSSDPQRNP